MTAQVRSHNMFFDYRYLAKEIATPVKVGVAFNPEKSIFAPYPQEFVAVWDTGATGTSISKEMALKLGLRQSGEIDVQGVTGSAKCGTYLIGLMLPNNIIIPEVQVSDCEGNIGCDVLIGMDVIGMGDFAVCNKNRSTTFSFCVPSIRTIDFTRDPLPGSTLPPVAKAGRNAPCPCGSRKKYKKCCGQYSS